MLTRKEIETMISLIIGDGSLYKSKQYNSYSFIIGHGAQQEDYLVWKMNIFNKEIMKNNPVTNKRKIIHDKRNNKDYTQSYFSKTSKDFSEIYNILYPNGIKSINDSLQYIKSDRFLAIWFMDDGSVFKRKKKNKNGEIYYLRPSMKLCTESFTKDECNIILEWLYKKYRVIGYPTNETRRKNPELTPYIVLNFNCENAEKIYRIIKPFIIVDSMKKKFEYLITYYEKNIFKQ